MEKTECGVCGQWCDNKYRYDKSKNVLHMECGRCGYKWDVTPPNKKVLKQKDAVDLTSKLDKSKIKLEQTEKAIEIITKTMLNKIEELSDDE